MLCSASEREGRTSAQTSLRLQASAGQRFGGRRTAPIQVAATTKAKITQARQAAPSTSAAKGGGLQQVQFRNAAQAVAAVEMMKPLLAKAKKVIASELKGAPLAGAANCALCLLVASSFQGTRP